MLLLNVLKCLKNARTVALLLSVSAFIGACQGAGGSDDPGPTYSFSSGLQIKMNPTELARVSDLVVRGTVDGRSTVQKDVVSGPSPMLDNSQATKTIQRNQFKVTEYLRGTGSNEITVSTEVRPDELKPMGEVPELALGQEYILFLDTSEGTAEFWGGYLPIGLQGTWTVEDGQAIPADASKGTLTLEQMRAAVRADG